MKNIAVIGGGIGGFASAIFLARKGFDVTVFDKAISPKPVGAGFLLQPPGQQVLRSLGVLETVKENSVPINRLHSQTVHGRQLLDLEYRDLKGDPRNGLGVQRTVIYEALLNKALQYSNIEVRWSSNIQKIVNADNSATVLFDKENQVFDFCILSSGSNSELAQEHFPNRVKRSYGWGCLWTTIALPADLDSNVLHQRVMSTRKMMGILPVFKDKGRFEAAVYWSMKSSELDNIDHQYYLSIANEIAEFWPSAKASIERIQPSQWAKAKYHDVWTPTPYKSRLVAIGDVCHATSPQLGQGCTMALVDAYTLTQCFTLGKPIEHQHLENWWSNRKSQLIYVRHLSRLLTPLFQSESKLCELFRDWFMAPGGRLPLAYTLQLKTLASEVFLPDIASG